MLLDLAGQVDLDTLDVAHDLQGIVDVRQVTFLELGIERRAYHLGNSSGHCRGGHHEILGMIGEHEQIRPQPVGKFIEPNLTPAFRMRTPCSTTTISVRLVDAVESSVLSEIRPAPSAWGRHDSSACKVSDPSTIPVEAQGPASPESMILGTKGTVSNPVVHLIKKTRIPGWPPRVPPRERGKGAVRLIEGTRSQRRRRRRDWSAFHGRPS